MIGSVLCKWSCSSLMGFHTLCGSRDTCLWKSPFQLESKQSDKKITLISQQFALCRSDWRKCFSLSIRHFDDSGRFVHYFFKDQVTAWFLIRKTYFHLQVVLVLRLLLDVFSFFAPAPVILLEYVCRFRCSSYKICW